MFLFSGMKYLISFYESCQHQVPKMQEAGVEEDTENDKREVQQLRFHPGKLPNNFHFCQVQDKK